MYGKVIALVVVLAAVASAVPVPEPNPQPHPEPGYFNKYGAYIPTMEDFSNPASPYYNPNYPYYDPRFSPMVYHYSYNQVNYDPYTGLPIPASYPSYPYVSTHYY